MTWNTLTNLSPGDTLTAGEMDKIRENIEHLGAMKIGGTLISALATGVSGVRGAIGTYTGNAAATKAITGVGFQPDFLLIWQQGATNYGCLGLKTSAMGANAVNMIIGYPSFPTDLIISLDSGGFTVGDNTTEGIVYSFNQNTVVYGYLALKF